MLTEANTLSEAAADGIDALLHLSLLATASGYPEFGRTAREAIHALLASSDAGCVIPAEYIDLENQQ
jgi:hypothetical protein